MTLLLEDVVECINDKCPARRDQVVFVEKDRKAQTHLTPMLSLKLENGAKPRTDSNYEKNYLDGKYGAIPYYRKDFEGCDD